MKIVHVIHDDKFPIMAYRTFEAVFPGQNEFVIFTNKTKLTHVSEINPTIYKRSATLFPSHLRKLINGNVVIFHSMNTDNLRVLSALTADVKTIWIGWGFDYYDLLPVGLLKERTARCSQGLSPSMGGRVIKNLTRLVKKILYINLDKKSLINKVNVFSPVLYEDYELLKRYLSEFKPVFCGWNYGTLEDDHIRGFEGKYVNGNNILLGNSATATNNHLEALEILRDLDLVGREVIAPLSYGDALYRDCIVLEGRAVLGDTFKPLIEFMPIDEYISVLQSCSVVVMNHLRQQALGNIVIALYMGAKVFLDERNPVYSFLFKKEAYIFKLQQLREELNSTLSDAQIARNRQILREYWSRDIIYQKTRNLVEQALKS